MIPHAFLSRSALLSAWLLMSGIQFASAQESVCGAAPAFKDGDAVCFLGDSITKGGQYQSYIHLFYATRFPDLKIKFFNCGVGGDRAAGILNARKFRLDVDVLGHKPAVVTVMLGMNDVSRKSYGPQAKGPKLEQERQEALALYSQSMQEIIRVLQGAGARIILLTPSIYDETATLPDPRFAPLTGVNGALGKCAAMVRMWAAEQRTGLVNCYEVMNSVNRRQQALDPAYSITGAGKNWNDRVHPGPVGNLVMAYTMLKAQSMPRYVAKISPAAAERTNCRIEKLTVSAKGAEFDCLENALPFVPPAHASGALKLVPFMEELNQELLTVAGLAEGSYDLMIDGQAVGVFSAKELKSGVNLAGNALTPQYKQSAQATELMLKLQLVGEQLREVATMRYGLASRGLNAMDQAVYNKAVTELYEKTAAKGPVEAWLKTQYEEVQFPGKLDLAYTALLAQFQAACRPQPHHYSLHRKYGPVSQ